ncbi:MAG: acyl-CoA thioesterase [Acidimicrobiales bacterium]
MSDPVGAEGIHIVGGVNRVVPPRHCDAQAMVHASRRAECFEDAFLAWLDSACAGYDSLRAAGADPVIAESTVRYVGSASRGDEVSASAVTTERGRTSPRFKLDLTSRGEVLASATTTYVGVGESGPVVIPDITAPALSRAARRVKAVASESRPST